MLNDERTPIGVADRGSYGAGVHDGAFLRAARARTTCHRDRRGREAARTPEGRAESTPPAFPASGSGLAGRGAHRTEYLGEYDPQRGTLAPRRRF